MRTIEEIISDIRAAVFSYGWSKDPYLNGLMDELEACAKNTEAERLSLLQYTMALEVVVDTFRDKH